MGYGAHYIARRKTRIAVVGAGYSHGFGVERTSRSGGGLRAALRVLRLGRGEPELLAVSGTRRFPVLGSVGMCDTVLDVTGAEIRGRSGGTAGEPHVRQPRSAEVLHIIIAIRETQILADGFF